MGKEGEEGNEGIRIKLDGERVTGIVLSLIRMHRMVVSYIVRLINA